MVLIKIKFLDLFSLSESIIKIVMDQMIGLPLYSSYIGKEIDLLECFTVMSLGFY